VNIIRVGAKEKMIRPDTLRIITVMAGKKAIDNWPIVQLVRKTMGKDHSLSSSPNSNTPIASGVKTICPEPACVSFLNFRPETLFGRFRIAPVALAFFTAKSAMTLGDNILFHLKRLLAILAIYSYALALPFAPTVSAAKAALASSFREEDKFFCAPLAGAKFIDGCVTMRMHSDLQSVCHASGCFSIAGASLCSNL
jgi:hypothetical protein